MNIIEISCPTKTFILGEYAVLDGGPAVVLNTAPRFICRIQKNKSHPQKINLSENSPAGQWIRKNPNDFQTVQIKWCDGYKNKGGLGFSSAQFNILYAYSFILREGSIDQIKPQDIWRSYRNLRFEGFLPSGADVITQWMGGVCVFEQNPLSIETLTASLPNLRCAVLRTGEYFETYKYLKNFKLGDVSDLKHISQQGVKAIKHRDEEGVIEAVNDYRRGLQAKNYVSSKSQDIQDRFARIKAIKAYKGCGAMGAETLIVLYKKQDEEEVKKEVSFLEYATDGNNLTYGVTFNRLTKPTEVLY